ncbi:MAG: hypothetical protein C4293_01955 [Nitrospiraceae bacterium]
MGVTLREGDSTPVTSISVVIADSKKSNRAAYIKQLKSEKGIQVVGEAGTSWEVIEAMRLQPRILLLDWNMCTIGEVGLLSAIRLLSPRTKVILLTGRRTDTRLIDALSGGAQGYLKRNAIRSFLAKAVRVVDRGEAWVPRAMVPVFLAVFDRIGLA